MSSKAKRDPERSIGDRRPNARSLAERLVMPDLY
jgi:hypothetical protein